MTRGRSSAPAGKPLSDRCKNNQPSHVKGRFALAGNDKAMPVSRNPARQEGGIITGAVEAGWGIEKLMR